MAGSRNLESVFDKSLIILVFAWFDFYFSRGSKLLTEESRGRIFNKDLGVSDFTIRHP